ncbi:basic secretory protein-like protein [Pseudoalteromonas sp. MMG012]|uniref:basic secretory protein-like protein n=1 Tax=Pseudoalteromonas sp. MMG012 TaxID=2822686 RepID=UPI001B3A2142|nr:basic secretory protein-like protein [Pseudoalteromonas sp. MMG012]MBQ4849655.1 hypothetical protein [Pseudoalteromonas sp. MMG012]
MFNFKYPAVMFAICTVLTGCNDGSGFTPTLKNDTSELSSAVVDAAQRNMAQDAGATIEAFLQEGVNASPAGEQVTNLIDGNSATKYLAFDGKATIVFSSVKPFELKGYNFISANDEPKRDPMNWVVFGSHDKSEWVEIDSRSNEAFEFRGLTRSFVIEEATEYQHFKFEMVHGGTDSYGSNILQLAEIQLMVVSDVPLVEFIATNTTPAMDELVVFKDESLVNPTSWKWTFEGGTPETSNEKSPLVKFSSLGAKSVTLVAANDKGESTLIKEDYIRVWDENEPWKGFENPSVTFERKQPTHPGQVALERVMPDLESVIQDISLKIAKRLFDNVTQINTFESVTFITDEYDFPAAKGGSDKHMELMFDLNHIAKLESQGDDALREEILGVLWHELTHGYNNSPKTGQYITGTDYHTYLESLANFIRIEAGFYEYARANITWVKDYNEDAYNQTSFFLEWVVKSHRNIDFIKQFNASAKILEEWSFDLAFKHIFGEARGIDTVFSEYIQYLSDEKGIMAPFTTPVEGYQNISIEDGVLVTTNATHIGIWDEGPDELIDNNINNKFNALIEAPWWVAEYAASLLPIADVSSVYADFILPEAKIVEKYSIATAKDNEIRFPSRWDVYGSHDGLTWKLIDTQNFSELPQLSTTYTFDVQTPDSYTQVRFDFYNERTGDQIGGDEGRLVQIGEIALLIKE